MAQVRHGKGGKARVATFGPTAAAVVRRYLSQEHGNAANAAAPLFEGRPGRPLGRSGIYRLVRKRAVAAGVEGRKGLHRLRHSCAVQHLLHGGNARTVQEQLGHADMEMTRRYTAVLDVEDRRRQWRDTSPVEHTLKAPPVRVADEGNDTVPERRRDRKEQERPTMPPDRPHIIAASAMTLGTPWARRRERPDYCAGAGP
jgi:hypothetical protein